MNGIVKGGNQKSKKNAIKILIYFRNHKRKLSNYLMIILKLYLKLNIKQDLEKDSKY